ncbi:MAG: gluconate 2-dehydrogenase subunit 3 family protein, partial [Saprospiraceae bacterium]
MGGVVSAPTVFAVLEGCKPAATSTSTASEVFALSSSDQNLLAELAEVIIPKTNTPGAKEAGVGPFIELMLKDCYSPIQQAHFQ